MYVTWPALFSPSNCRSAAPSSRAAVEIKNGDLRKREEREKKGEGGRNKEKGGIRGV